MRVYQLIPQCWGRIFWSLCILFIYQICRRRLNFFFQTLIVSLQYSVYKRCIMLYAPRTWSTRWTVRGMVTFTIFKPQQNQRRERQLLHSGHILHIVLFRWLRSLLNLYFELCKIIGAMLPCCLLGVSKEISVQIVSKYNDFDKQTEVENVCKWQSWCRGLNVAINIIQLIPAQVKSLILYELECGTWYYHPRRLQCVWSRNLRISKVATWHYRCRHNLKNNCIWDNLQCCLLVPRSPSKPVMLTFDLQSRKV